MEVPQDVVKKWQSFWEKICDIAYFRKDVVSELSFIMDVLGSRAEYNDICTWSLTAPNFEEITLHHSWEKVSKLKDENDNYVEPAVVPELREIYVPNVLFQTSGVFEWFKHSFPNCEIFFWEDDI